MLKTRLGGGQQRGGGANPQAICVFFGVREFWKFVKIEKIKQSTSFYNDVVR